MIRDLEKNHFAMSNFSAGRVIAAAILMSAFWLGALVGPWTGSIAGIAAGLGLLALCIPAALAARRLRWPVAAVLLVPLFAPVFGVSLVNSAAVTLRHDGVRWRDTFYPLAALRAGLVR